MKIFSLTIIIFAFSVMFSFSKAQVLPQSFENLLTKIQESGNAVITEIPTELQKAEWKGEAREIDPEISLPALVKLWLVGGEQDFVLLEWWRKRDNASIGRIFIVSIFDCLGEEPTSAKPNFPSFAERFDTEEEKSRTLEIEFVSSNRKNIAKQLATIMKATEPQFRSSEASSLISQYERVAE